MIGPSASDKPRFHRRTVFPLVGLALLLSSQAAAAADPDDDNPYRPGIIAGYKAADGAEHVRLEDEIAHEWNDRSPDRRMAPGPFTAHFRGRLWVQSPGVHRLRVFAAGSVRLELNGKLLLDRRAARPEWLDAEPIELPFGFHPLKIEYRRSDEPARLALYWEGPQFGLEPLSARWLFHDQGQTPSPDFERGERLVRALRCAACHELPGEGQALAAPALTSLEGNLSRAWLVDWLSTAAPQSAAGRRMPHFVFSRPQAESLTEALFSASEPLAGKPAAPPSAKKDAATKGEKRQDSAETPPPSVSAGATLFRSVGCLACHRVGELGADGLFGGGDLSRVADKRPPDFFARWLTDPARLNRDHRMPVFAIEPHERESLALYLQSLGGPAAPGVTKSVPRTDDGARLVRLARCAACHALPKSLAAEPVAKPEKLAMAALSRANNSCLFEPDAADKRPGYRLADDDRRAIRTFLAGIERAGGTTIAQTGPQLLRENNCLACHARGSSVGLAGHLPAVAEADVALRDILPALSPPALWGIGDKLHDDALAGAIKTPERPRRPWLRVRMPKYPLTDEQTAALVRHFVETDRIGPRPDDAHAAPATLSTAELDVAGPRLVTADGFGCTSCHAIGKWTPQKVALNAQGSALEAIGRRLRRAWFDRWVRNPARIVPRMEMPAVQQSIRGVLDGHLDSQLAAVWHVLDRPDFTPPAPGALRVVRRANLPGVHERAAVLTDVIEAAGKGFVKPLVIGFENRHNVLIDLANHRLAAWWIGDTARQQTSGKTWFWEAGVPQLLDVDESSADTPGDLLLAGPQGTVAPVVRGQFVTEFDSNEHVGSGLKFTNRLQFQNHNQPLVVCVVQQFDPLPSVDQRSGFRRTLEIERSPVESKWELVALPGDVTLDAQGRVATLTGPQGEVRVTLTAPANARLTKNERGAAVIVANAGDQHPSCQLEYRSVALPDQFALPPEVDRSVPRAELNVVPGFRAVRLPLTDQAMPTGLAWRPDGTLVVSSLEGRVWLARDDDGDGLEDRLLPFSDELAAPFGVAASGKNVDVVNKYGLMRLIDADNDGHAERTELLASGWGHTRDYHDWAVGLPRDEAGNYYVSLASQQDDRSESAANLRGRVVRLMPREADDDDPRRFTIQELAAGFRFPQGIARSRTGDLFVTDQQGHYTPFNELNHVLPDTRYGFINRLESRRGLNPPFKSAAIEIPHPWTRSVNGICFLETPAAVCEKLGRDLFGPLEGHLVGCEYDTRRLVRMSLEQVGDEFQGAVYPYSTEPAAGEETFEGPLVCQLAPDGDLYVGNIRDSGWGAGANTGSIVRITHGGDLPCGIAQVRAARDGFAIEFTGAVDREKAARTEHYAISSYRRTPTPAYGGEDQDRCVQTIRSIAVADDARRVDIRLDNLREGFVYEFHLGNLSPGGPFFPAEAYYTLRHRLP